MSTEDNKAIIRRYLEAIRADKSASTLATYIEGDEELIQHIAMSESAFPGYYIVADDLIAEGDRVMVRGVVYGMHRGEFMGLPPTDNQVAFQLFIIYRLANGKIVEHWMLADNMALMQQLGAIPAPEAAHA